MQEVVQFLKENQVQYFSTIGVDGKPKVRPFQYMIEEDGKLYFCTSNKKDVYEELEKNPYVELCASNPSFAWLRLSGKAIFTKDLDIKEKIVQSSELVKSIYKTGENSVFEAFYLDEVKAVISDFSGNPPKVYNL